MNNTQKIISKIFMAFMMSLCISFILNFINFGFSEIFLKSWMRSRTIAFLSAAPLAFFLPPLANKIVVKYIR